MAKKHATDFEKIIHADRERKQKEALAARIFNRDKRSSTSAKTLHQAPAAPLASRVGVKKQRLSSSTGGSDNLRVHDKHRLSAFSTPGSLANRIATAGAATRHGSKLAHRGAKLAFALSRDQMQTPAAVTERDGSGISIRGLAGAPIVMAQNFAPGTTAADIESAFTPFGGVVSRCRLLKISPIIVAEIVFEDPTGAQRVIDRFNNQVADGRVLKVYHKAGSAVTTPGSSNAGIIDGSHGFAAYEKAIEINRDGGELDGKLYSDSLLSAKGTLRPTDTSSSIGAATKAVGKYKIGTSSQRSAGYLDGRRGRSGPGR